MTDTTNDNSQIVTATWASVMKTVLDSFVAWLSTLLAGGRDAIATASNTTKIIASAIVFALFAYAVMTATSSMMSPAPDVQKYAVATDVQRDIAQAERSLTENFNYQMKRREEVYAAKVEALIARLTALETKPPASAPKKK